MDWLRILLSRAAAPFRSKKLDADLDEELRAHIELAIEENRTRGMNEPQAAMPLCAPLAASRRSARPTASGAACPGSTRPLATSAMPFVNCASRPASRSLPS